MFSLPVLGMESTSPEFIYRWEVPTPSHELKFSGELCNAQSKTLKFSLQTVPCKAQAVSLKATETLAIAMWLGMQSHSSLRIPPPRVGEASPGERGFLTFLGDIPDLVSGH